MIVLSDEQVMLRDMAQGWVKDHAPITAARALRDEFADKGYDPALYAEIAEMGWTGIVVPEDAGGVGMGFTTLGLIAEELGRTLVASPLLASAGSAVSALTLGSNEAAREAHLGAIVDGSTTYAYVPAEPAARQSNGPILTKQTDGGWSLTGKRKGVPYGAGVDALVVEALLPDDTPALFYCPANHEGLSARSLDRLDARGAADLAFEGVQLGQDALLGRGASYCEKVLDRSRAVLSAEMLGASEQAFDITLAYLRERVQFGQPIGAFQALQHRAAEWMGELLLARAAVYTALEAIDCDASDVRENVSIAKALAGECFSLSGREMIQLHGGIGMTEEHNAGLYFKRAAVANATLGNPAYHRDRFAELTGI